MSTIFIFIFISVLSEFYFFTSNNSCLHEKTLYCHRGNMRSIHSSSVAIIITLTKNYESFAIATAEKIQLCNLLKFMNVFFSFEFFVNIFCCNWNFIVILAAVFLSVLNSMKSFPMASRLN